MQYDEKDFRGRGVASGWVPGDRKGHRMMEDEGGDGEGVELKEREPGTTDKDGDVDVKYAMLGDDLSSENWYESGAGVRRNKSTNARLETGSGGKTGDAETGGIGATLKRTFGSIKRGVKAST